MSIFSGLNARSLTALVEAARSSPRGLAALAVAGIIALLALALAVAYAARHIGGFYARIEREEEEEADAPSPSAEDASREAENADRGEAS